MGEHRDLNELVARVTNQAIEIERMRGELRSVRKERDHWIEVAADLRGQLAGAAGGYHPEDRGCEPGFDNVSADEG